MDKKLIERKLQWRKRMRKRGGGHKIEAEKGDKLNFEVCLTSFTFIKVVTSVRRVFIYSLGH